MSAIDWTCNRCEVTASWMKGTEAPALPASWAEEAGEVYCLACRRELAADAGVLAGPEDASTKDRQQLRAKARVDFEVRRDPERPDGRIAQACHTSIPAVRKSRVRLGLEAAPS